MSNDIQDFYSAQASQQAHTKERNSYPEKIKELEQKLAESEKMRDFSFNKRVELEGLLAESEKKHSAVAEWYKKALSDNYDLEQKLSEALEVIRSWMIFENNSIERHGEYEGVEINSLIKCAREFLKKHDSIFSKETSEELQETLERSKYDE